METVAGPAGFTRSMVRARAMQPPAVQAPNRHPLWGTAFSASSPETAQHIQDTITNWAGLKNTTDGFDAEYIRYIREAITGHITSDEDNSKLPIILVFYDVDVVDVGSSGPISDPRVFEPNDYVLVFTNNTATGLNTSIVSGIYRVETVNRDNTLTVAPANHLTNPLEKPNVLKTKCALLRKHLVKGKPRLIIMVLEYVPLSNGGAKSSRRRKRRPSRSKSVNKKRKYTQQRVRRRSHRR
jgi:hypothetical protein